MGESSRKLIGFAAHLKYNDIPEKVVERTKFLFLDWLGSCIGGSKSRQVEIIMRSMHIFGESGKSEIVTEGSLKPPFFAAFVNGASSHTLELDDLHNASVLHPGTVVFPAALATAQDMRSSGKDFLLASVIGYEIGTRVAQFLGKSHYRIFHTTGTAGTLAAAMATSSLLGADLEEFTDSLGNAGTQASGFWEFLKNGGDSKQLHSGGAASKGLLSAYLSHNGFTGAMDILEGEQGMGVGMSGDPESEKLTAGLGKRWAVLDTSVKYYASCRHTHPSIEALNKAMTQYELQPEMIKSITAHVHQAALDVLGPISNPITIHQSKFSMEFVLSLFAIRRTAGVNDFSQNALYNQQIRDFMPKIKMVLDNDIEEAYPEVWNGKVEVELASGRRVTSEVKHPKGDPEDFLTLDEEVAKFRNLCNFVGTKDEVLADGIIDLVASMESRENVGYFFSGILSENNIIHGL